MLFQRYNQVMDLVTCFSNQLLFFVPPVNALNSPGFINKFQGLFVSAGMFFVIQPTSFAYFSQTSIGKWMFAKSKRSWSCFLSYNRPASLTFRKHPFANGCFSLFGEGGPWHMVEHAPFLITFRPHITHERRSPPTSPPLTSSCISLFLSVIYHSQYFSCGQQSSNNRHCSSSSFIFLLLCH